MDEAPILDLRVRKAARRNGRQGGGADQPAQLARPPTPTRRCASHPARARPRWRALAAELGSRARAPTRRAGRARGRRAPARWSRRGRRCADAGAGGDPVGRARSRHGDRGPQAADALLAVAGALGLAGERRSGLIEVPAGHQRRAGCARWACLPDLGPGLARRARAAGTRRAIARRAGRGRRSPRWSCSTPTRCATHPDRGPGSSALDRATAVVAFADFGPEDCEEHATVVFPAELYAEKEGTVTHPDGRIQRVRQAIGAPGRDAPGLARAGGAVPTRRAPGWTLRPRRDRPPSLPRRSLLRRA